MTYSQGTIVSANAANDIAVILDDLLTGAGWTVVETLTPSGNYRNVVYKSAAGDNGLGYDWFLVVCYTTLGTENYVIVFSGSDYGVRGTHVMSPLGAPFEVGSGNYVTFQDGMFSHDSGMDFSTFHVTGAAYSISYPVDPLNSSTPGFQTLIPSSAFAYWASISLVHFALFTTVAVNKQDAVYTALALDSDYVAAGLYSPSPVVGWDIHFRAASGFLGLAGTNVATGIFRSSHMYYSRPFGAKLPSLSDEYFPAYAWQPHVYIDFLNGGPSGDPFEGTALQGGVHVGHAPDIYLVWGGSIGDTIEILSATYVLTGPLGSTAADAGLCVALLVE